MDRRDSGDSQAGDDKPLLAAPNGDPSAEMLRRSASGNLRDGMRHGDIEPLDGIESEMEDMDPRGKPAPLMAVIWYTLIMVPSAMVVIPMQIYVNKFFADLMLVPMQLLAVVTALSRLLDCIVDPMIGKLSDNLDGDFEILGMRGRRLPMIGICGPLAAAAFWALFNMPSPLTFPAGIRAGWFALFNTLFCWFSAGWYIPYMSLGVEMTHEYESRATIFAAGSFAQGLGFLASAAMPVLLLQWTHGDQRKMFVFYTSIIAIILALCPLLLACTTREPPGHESKNTLVPMLRRAMRNRPMRLLIPTFFTSNIVTVMAGYLLPFYVSYVVAKPGGRDPNKMLILCMMSLWPAALVSIPFWRWLARRPSHGGWGKKVPFLAGWALLVCYSSSLIVLIPSNEGYYTTFIIGNACAGLAVGGWSFLFHSIQADVVDYDTFHSGEHREGQFIMFWSVIPRLVSIPASAIPMQVLAWVGYVPNKLPQEPAVTVTIIALMLGVPSFMAMVAIWIMLKYPITERSHALIWDGIKAHQEGRSFTDPLTGVSVPPPPESGSPAAARRDFLDHFSEPELRSMLKLVRGAGYGTDKFANDLDEDEGNGKKKRRARGLGIASSIACHAWGWTILSVVLIVVSCVVEFSGVMTMDPDEVQGFHLHKSTSSRSTLALNGTHAGATAEEVQVSGITVFALILGSIGIATGAFNWLRLDAARLAEEEPPSEEELVAHLEALEIENAPLKPGWFLW